MIKYLFLGLLGLVAFMIIIITAYLGPDDLAHCKQPVAIGHCSRADAIVAVSGGDTIARTNEAIRLYKAGWAPKLIFSGAAADSDGPSNARAMEARALRAGVSESDIIIEEFSRTTAENAANTSQFITDRNIHAIILVTSAYHQRRASLEFGTKLGAAVRIFNHPVATDRQWAGKWWWTTKGGWWLAGSELLKIAAFYSQNEITP